MAEGKGMVLFLARLTSVLIFFGSRGKMANSLEHCFLQTQQRAKHPFLLEAQWHRFSFQGGYGARWSLAGFCITGMLAPTVHWLLRLYLISKDLIPTCRLLGRSSSYLILLQWILKVSKDFFCVPRTSWCTLIMWLWDIDFFFSTGS